MEGGTVTTDEAGAHGVYAGTTESGDATAQMKEGTVTTGGEGAHGIWAVSVGGRAIAELDGGAEVTALGVDSDGIYAEGGAGFDVDVAGSVTGGAGTGAAIRTISSAGGTIDVASGANVTAGKSGLAIQDGDGDAVVTLEGTITGDIILGAGGDTLELKDGSVTGRIDGGAGHDHLTLSGQTMTTTVYNLINWERVTLDTALSINAGSVFHATGGQGGMTIVGDVNNQSDVVFSVQDGVAGDEITIEGNYTGSEANSNIFVLETDGANTDRLVITGDASGEMMLSLASLGSGSAVGAPLELNLVSVGGASNDATFTLIGNHITPDGEGAIISGVYLYTLAEAADGRSWALSARSESGEVTYQPSAPIYDSYGASLLAFNAPSGLYA
ncbi:autotransporter outer membrane beta-barrel domain-containing protein, partial [Cognatiyoonia sp. IB215182]|uniref:autotransporter outer membrane beta-barrel domain-containing protein n=1 Tax=Cognatiyoonia sp. IB215182 TaxID=3097353 RepID=UPI002A15A84B